MMQQQQKISLLKQMVYFGLTYSNSKNKPEKKTVSLLFAEELNKLVFTSIWSKINSIYFFKSKRAVEL